jgi:hypothetical protein
VIGKLNLLFLSTQIIFYQAFLLSCGFHIVKAKDSIEGGYGAISVTLITKDEGILLL